MKNFFSVTVVLAFLFVSSLALAAKYEIDPSHSRVEFTVKHLVSRVTGNFKDFDGGFDFDPKAAAKSSGTITIKAASINTDNEKRDTHLKSGEFFDVEKFPTLTIENAKLTPSGKDKYKLKGNLVIHGVTKPATFDVEYLGAAKDPWGSNRAGFVAKTKINRKDYGLTWNKTLDNGGLLVGDDVDVVLQIEAIEKADAKK